MNVLKHFMFWGLALGLLLHGWDLMPDRVWACSCAYNDSVQEEMAKRTAVFSGRVVDLEKKRQGLTSSSADPVFVHLETDRVWKGQELGRKITVSTALSGASCGYTFEEGREYLVYAHGEMDQLQVSLCSLTKPLIDADSDLLLLGEGQAPTGPGGFTHDGNDLSLMIGTGIIAGVALFMALIVVILLRLRRKFN